MAEKFHYRSALAEYFFSKSEWTYLMRQDLFQKELEKPCNTLDDIETVALFGNKLLQEHEDSQSQSPLI